ncbi:MAG: type VI secretion system tube protein Hcp [Caldimonas sp.]
MAKASQFLKLIDKRRQPVLGECIDADHRDEIDLNSWSWSVKDPAALPKIGDSTTEAEPEAKVKGKGKAPSKATESDADAKMSPDLFSISKRTDRSTVRLINAMDNGEVFDEATIVIEEEYEGSATRAPFYMEIKLTDVLVVKLDLNVDAGAASAEFKENWGLNYGNVKFSYRLRDGNRGTMDLEFTRPRDSGTSFGKKVKKSAAEVEAEEKKKFDELRKTEKKSEKKSDTKSDTKSEKK